MARIWQGLVFGMVVICSLAAVYAAAVGVPVSVWIVLPLAFRAIPVAWREFAEAA